MPFAIEAFSYNFGLRYPQERLWGLLLAWRDGREELGDGRAEGWLGPAGGVLGGSAHLFPGKPADGAVCSSSCLQWMLLDCRAVDLHIDLLYHKTFN